METHAGGEEVEEKVVELAAEEDEEESEEQQLMSTLTFERVAAAKKFIEDHYKAHTKLIQQRKIAHWKNHLKFPDEARLSPEAKDLISGLLCDVQHRLGSHGAEQIKACPWFKDILWDKLYSMEAAYKPEVNGELDAQNFMKFDEAAHIKYGDSEVHYRRTCVTDDAEVLMRASSPADVSSR